MPRTGPTSPRAKARVSRNAVRHGLRSSAVVIPGIEREHDWQLFLEDALESLAPVGAMEYALAERAATLLWRLRRAARAERDAAVVIGRRRTLGLAEGGDNMLARWAEWNKHFACFSHEPEKRRDLIDEFVQTVRPIEPPAALPPMDTLNTLSKYEYRLSRQLRHALLDLQVMQDRRQGRPTPTARIDVTGLESD